MSRIYNNKGFTLMEIIVVIVIIGIVAAVSMRSVNQTISAARVENTRKEMEQIKYAVSGNPNLYSNGTRTDFGYVGDIGSLPPNVDALVSNPGGYATWNGPYLDVQFVEAGDEYKRDAWGNLYTFNGQTIQSSGGGGGSISLNTCNNPADLTANTVSGVVTDASGNPPGDSSVNISLSLIYPDGNGGLAIATAPVSSGGAFVFNSIPVGNHTLTAVYSSTADTVKSYLSVAPGIGAMSSLRFPGAVWAGVEEASASSAIAYVDGTAQCPNNNDETQFNIQNTTGDKITVTWLIASFTHTPTPYFEKIKWGNKVVYESTSPRAASGDTLYFNPTRNLNAYKSAKITLQYFRDIQSGAGVAVDMRHTNITIGFSDGSIATFNSGN